MKKLLVILAVSLVISPALSGQENEILQLKEKIIDLQNEGELGFKEVALCSKIFGFGSYVALEKPVVDKDGEVLVYFEPANVFTNRKNGLYEIWYKKDMVLMKEDGEVLEEWTDIVDFHYTAKRPVLDLFVRNNISLGGQVPPGKYQFKAVLKDQLSGKTAVKIIDFEIR
ncbi:MAG: hypothetical protein R6V02_12515 [Candidatus Aminicenantes bacterium]